MADLVRLLDLRGRQVSADLVARELPRAIVDMDSAVAEVRPLVAQIRAEGVKALVSIAQKFDGIEINPIKVPADELSKALSSLEPNLKKSLETAIERVRKVTEQAKPQGFTSELANGAQVQQRYRPIDSVGLYVPGGKAVYPSSVIMNVVPAQIAGVKKLAISTPGQKDFGGRAHPTVLATAALLGVEDVYVIGGPAAVIAFAYGIPEIGLEPVNLVTGPGNLYVAAAKRLLRGVIAIDSEAGPTEVMVIADSSANPEFVAADLISQAEHDELAAAVLITDSADFAEQVRAAIAEQVALTRNKSRVLAALSGQQSAVVLVSDLNQAAQLADFYATEHLELQTASNDQLLEQISNAGAIFVGDFSPVSLGDYLAGSNHVLPTGGQARFGSGLGVHTFLRPQQVIKYSESALSEVANNVVAIADSEGLQAHGDAIRIRF
ncbi:MAG: histidinol dehydrogenase [Micrococcales bacterium]|nr:histidinol dehydrogenase [Actinomycetota bacterium]NCA07255.1 histidinol dehydrogenase [Micrococcales bacterium]